MTGGRRRDDGLGGAAVEVEGHWRVAWRAAQRVKGSPQPPTQRSRLLWLWSTCSLVPRVHSAVEAKTLAYSAHEPDMQTPSELSHSSLSKTDPGSRLDAPHWPSEAIHFTVVSRILKPLLKSHNALRLRTKLLLWLVLFYAAPTFAPPVFVRLPGLGPRPGDMKD